MFDLVGEVRNLVTVLMKVESDLKEIIKTMKKEEEPKAGGAKK